jgi:outer membrane immunogenic protein
MRRIVKRLTASALSLGASMLIASAALADGYVLSYGPVPGFSWTGLYIGGGGGYAWGSGLTDMNVSGFFNQRATPDLSSGIFSGHIGLNYQMGFLVVGAEAQILSGVSGSENAPFVGCTVGGVQCLVRGTVDVEDTVVLKGRLGVAFNRWLPYVTGGIASGDISSRFRDINFNGGTNVVHDTERHSGWTVGGGTDFALTRNWILGVEYEHITFDDGIHRGFNNFGATVATRDHLVNADVDTVMARLSYKFGPREEYRPLK